MDFKGKRAVFLGDSITEGVCTTSSDHIYHAILGRILGLKEVVNAGVSGTRIAKQKQPTTEFPSFDCDFLSRIDDVDGTADYLFIFGGTNDFGHGDSEFGSADDKDEYTFCGAVNLLFEKAKTIFGAENVIILTPMRRTGMNDPKGNGSRRVECPPLKAYAEAEKAAAAKFGFKVIDLFNETGLDPNDDRYAGLFYDGLHPNDDGHRRLAEIIAARLASF